MSDPQALHAQSTDEKIAKLREWLRMHGDCQVTLNLHSVYGTVSVRVLDEQRVEWTDFGMTLGKRLDFALRALGVTTDG